MRVAPMPDHPHTIDRWDDATGENLIEQIAGVTDCQNNDMADAEAITPQTHQWTPRPSDRPSTPRVWPVAVGHWWVGRALLVIKSIG